ncbi:AhpC/TSA family protein [Alkalicoccus luteus]|uniref:AhpC/TSA family protein n=1 Tax=Alkalicoccus luteus TaxID=1237094 RepID=UPI00197C8604
MRRNYHEFEQKGADLKIIVPSSGRLIKRFLNEFGPYPFPFYGDRDRSLYKAMGHITMNKPKLLLMAALGTAAGKIDSFLPSDKAQRAVALHSMKTQDVYIQGGTWIYSESGALEWYHLDKSPDNHASVERILDQLA